MSSRTCNSIVCQQLLTAAIMTTPLSIIFCVYCMYFWPNCDPSSTGRCLQISGMFKRERGKMHPRMDNVWWVASHASRKRQRAFQISGLGQALGAGWEEAEPKGQTAAGRPEILTLTPTPWGPRVKESPTHHVVPSLEDTHSRGQGTVTFNWL